MNKLRNVVKKIKQSQIARDSLFSFLIKLASTFLALVTGILLARWLGPTQLGYYTFSLSIIEILLIPATLGLPLLIVRHTSGYQVNQEWSAISGLLIRAKQFATYTSIVVLVIGIPVGLLLSDSIQSLHFYTFCLAIATLPFLSYNAIRSAAMRGFGSIIYSQFADNIFRQVFFILIFLVLIQFQIPITSISSMVINLITVFAAFLVGIQLLKKFTPAQVHQASPEYRTKEWLVTLVPLILTQGIQVLNRHITILMLGTIDGPASTGIFLVALKGAELINFALVAINLVIAPSISKLYKQNKLPQLQRLMRLSSIAITIYSLLFTVIMLFFGKFLITAIFGSEYEASTTALLIIVGGQLVNSMIGSVGLLLSMTGYQKEILKGTAFVMVVLVTMNLILIPLYGFNGAAVSSMTGLVLWNLIMWYYVHRKLKINPTAFGKMKFS